MSKPLLIGLSYPYDWGFIPSTKADDGDPIDVRIIHEPATYPGLVLCCKPVGILEILQIKKGKKERNDRVFVVPDRSPFEADLPDIRRLPKRAVRELEQFFEATDALEDKKLEFLGWHGPSKALKAIKNARYSDLQPALCRHRKHLSCGAFSDEHRGERRMAKKEAKTLDELFHDTLKDIYFAEKKILATLPKMEKAAQAPDLKRAFSKHRTETEGHVDRLEKVFAAIDKKPQGKTCDAIVGITDEGAEIMKEYKGSPALDAGLLAAAQAVEHYEISRYGTLKTWASELGLSDAVALLDQTLAEEKKTDATLTEIAESVVNQEAEAA